MRDFSNPRVFIFSAYRADATERANQAAHAELVCDLALEGVPFQECTGFYEGEHEACVLVTGASATEVVERLATSNRQDTFLVVAEHDRAAYLVDTETGYHRHLGKLVCVGDTEPENGDPWTCVEGTYFQTRVTGRLVDLEGGI